MFCVLRAAIRSAWLKGAHAHTRMKLWCADLKTVEVCHSYSNAETMSVPLVFGHQLCHAAQTMQPNKLAN